MPGKRPVAEALAERIAALDAASLPAAVRDTCERLLLDVVGLCLVARRTDYVRAALSATTDPRSGYFDLIRAGRMPPEDVLLGRMDASVTSVLAQLNALNVPCGPILSAKELLDEPSLIANEMIVTVAHPQRGSFKTVGCPIKLSDSPVTVATAPLLGEHNEEIYLDELCIDRDRFAQLQRDGVI